MPAYTTTAQRPPAVASVYTPGVITPPEKLAWYRAATDPDVFAWLHHIASAAGCTHPIRLTGRLDTVDSATNAVLGTVSTDSMPDGVIYKSCGNRRASVCPSCSTTYRRDAYQLIRAGLVGGKGIPATVSTHPAVFATFTAPGFGPVHTQRRARSGAAIPCRPRREPDLCPHGVDLRCDRIHGSTEPVLGIPLCLDCYDHNHQVIWNFMAGELWRRTRIGLDRSIAAIARIRGIQPSTVRLSYGKVAEMQRRGVVHYHVIIRLDGVDPTDKNAVVPAPDGLGLLDLVDAIAHTAAATAFTSPVHHATRTGWPIAWGEQLDIRPVRLSGDNTISDEQVAGYLAKYATKTTEAAGHVSRRLDEETIDVYADPDGTHAERLIDACWVLGDRDHTISGAPHEDRPYRKLRNWAHMLGFGGHFLTKSRRYSVSFRILRGQRVIWHRTQNVDQDQAEQETTTLIGSLRYAGSGWHNHGDALLANSSAALARERRRVGRIESNSLN